MKKILSLLFVAVTTFSSYCRGEDLSVRELDLLGPVGIRIPNGSSSWSARLEQAAKVNPLRVLFWIKDKCPTVPTTSVSVKYQNSEYWFSTTPNSQGYYYHDGGNVVEAIRLNFYQDQLQEEFCQVHITGVLEN